MNIHWRTIILWATRVTVVAVVLAVAPPIAQAIPAFARRYETSCQTCHTAFPGLTPFGEAFRRNGYRFPEGQDLERSMDEPVELGHPVHTDMFPDEVWPGELPGELPVALTLSASVSLQRGAGGGHAHGATPAIESHEGGHDAGGDDDWQTSFAGSEVGLVFGAPVGEHISFFGKLEFSGHGEILVERPHLLISPLAPHIFTLRIGAFEPSLHSFSVHRVLTSHTLALTTVSLGDNGWSPEPEQLGIEATGIAYHRIGWAVGVVEGAGNDANRDKDVYGRLELKLGGMSLDGYEPTGYSRPWEEKSITLGASAYRGVATFSDPSGLGGDQSDWFLRIGADITARLVDMTVTLAGFRQRDQRPIWGQDAPGSLLGGMAQVDYVIFPWLIPTVRWTVFRQDLPGMEPQNAHRVTVGTSALLRSNIAIRLMAQGGDDPNEDPELENVSLSVQGAF